ncbi:hypothetical protein Dda_4693 [Drechslerella dactyloides]|uniref:Uncharacterized protein n=1 Tax=Drechslerella dactyloides TaxID=74499 RepID=A0AAD6NJG2_DREDA|nr:hypothetical protein Dda_4693 [Drechslerella dactyloides]
MPWPWTSRPKSPFEFLTSTSDASSSGSATTKANGGGSNHGVSSPPTKTAQSNRPLASTATSRVTATAATPTTASSTTSSKPAAQRPSAAAPINRKPSFETSANNTRSASSLGFSTDPQPRKLHIRSTSSGASYVPVPATGFRTAASAVIPEEPAHIHTQLRTTKHNSNHAASSSSGTSKPSPGHKNSNKDSDRKATKSPEPSSRHHASVDSISSISSSLHSPDLSKHGHGKQRSISTGSQLTSTHGQLSPPFVNGRALSPAPSNVSATVHGSLPRLQKVVMPSSSRQSPTSEEVFYYELPESYEQVNGLNASEIEERDLKDKAVIDISTVLAAQPRIENQTRESLLEAEVARLKKLCDQLGHKSANASSTSVGSSDPMPIPEITNVPVGSSEAHRVVQVMKVANEHLQKKIEAKESLLADRLAELEQIGARHAISIEQQKHNFQQQIKQLVEQHRRELHGATQRNTKRVEAVKREMAQSAAAAENQQRYLEQITALQAQVEQLRNLDKTKQDNQNALLEEVKVKAAEELAAARREFAVKEETYEIQTEEMRRQLLEERPTAECNCGSKTDTDVIEQLKHDHETQVATLKASIRVLEGARGTTVEQLEEDQRVYRKVSELEASLASKVRALAAERKTSERLRASLTAVEESKAERSTMQDQDVEMFASKQDHDLELQQLRASFEKEKESLIAEYEAAIDASKRLRDEDRAVFEAERKRSQQLFADAKTQHQNYQEQTTFVHEDRIKVAQEQFEASLRNCQQEKQALQMALDEIRSQLVVQKSALELRLRTQLQEAEHQYILRHNSEKQTEAVKLEETQAELEKVRRELGEEVQKLRAEVAQTKDRDAQVVSELQQQMKDEEESKQQLLDRIAKAEADKDAVEADLAAAKSRFDGANDALAEQAEALRKAEEQIKTLNKSIETMKDEVESEKRVTIQTVSELRAQMQTRERKSNEFHALKQNEIESLHFQIRTAETKLQIDGVEMESLRETLRETESALAAIRDEKSPEAIWLDEKRSLIDKHNKLIDGYLSTIAKLEDTINKMRVRSTDEAKAAEAKAAEQQSLIVQWMAASNWKGDEVQRLERALNEANNMTEGFKLEIRALKVDLKQYEKESKDQKSEVKSINKQLKTAQDEYATLRTQMESMYRHTRQMSDLEARIQTLSKELQDSQQTVARRDATVRQLEDALQRALNSARAGRSSPAQAEQQRNLEESQTEVRSLKEKLDMYETEYRHLFDDYERLKIEQEDMKYKSTERVALGV